jgi:hypothetical protein
LVGENLTENMNFIDEIKIKYKELIKDQKAEGGFISYYMGVLLLSIIVLSVMIPTITEQIAALTNNVSSVTRTVFSLFALMLSLGLFFI